MNFILKQLNWIGSGKERRNDNIITLFNNNVTFSSLSSPIQYNFQDIISNLKCKLLIYIVP